MQYTWGISVIISLIKPGPPAEQQLKTAQSAVECRTVDGRPANLINCVHILYNSEMLLSTNSFSHIQLA